MKTKTDAARVLLDNGWTYEEIQWVLGGNEAPALKIDPLPVPDSGWWLETYGGSFGGPPRITYPAPKSPNEWFITHCHGSSTTDDN